MREDGFCTELIITEQRRCCSVAAVGSRENGVEGSLHEAGYTPAGGKEAETGSCDAGMRRASGMLSQKSCKERARCAQRAPACLK